MLYNRSRKTTDTSKEALNKVAAKFYGFENRHFLLNLIVHYTHIYIYYLDRANCFKVSVYMIMLLTVLLSIKHDTHIIQYWFVIQTEGKLALDCMYLVDTCWAI